MVSCIAIFSLALDEWISLLQQVPLELLFLVVKHACSIYPIPGEILKVREEESRPRYFSTEALQLQLFQVNIRVE
jgi:hypothetical protein